MKRYFVLFFGLAFLATIQSPARADDAAYQKGIVAGVTASLTSTGQEAAPELTKAEEAARAKNTVRAAGLTIPAGVAVYKSKTAVDFKLDLAGINDRYDVPLVDPLFYHGEFCPASVSIKLDLATERFVSNQSVLLTCKKEQVRMKVFIVDETGMANLPITIVDTEPDAPWQLPKGTPVVIVDLSVE